MRRRWALLAPLVLAACTADAPPRSFPPLRSDFLTPLPLNVGTLEIGEPPPPGALDAQSPAPPGPALKQMAQDRLSAGGRVGRAVFTIDEARVLRSGSGLDGVMAVHLEVLGADGARAGIAEARVTRRSTGVSRSELPGGLYDITRLMLADMNVEFEFQLRRSLQPWLQETTTAPAPAAVEKQDLTAP